MPTIDFECSSIEYTLIQKPNLKNISIKLDKNKTVTVSVPRSIPQEYVDELMYKKAPWILKKWAEFSELSAPPKQKLFRDGESFLYLGKSYPLKLSKFVASTPKSLKQQNKFTIQLLDKTFLLVEPIELPNAERVEFLHSLFKQFYIRSGQQLLVERLEIYSKTMGVTPTKVVFKEQKRRWGSCTGKRAIYLNWRLMMAPLSIIDYVLVHELAHVKHMNHSKEFWSFVQSILPNYKASKNWLKTHGAQLSL